MLTLRDVFRQLIRDVRTESGSGRKVRLVTADRK